MSAFSWNDAFAMAAVVAAVGSLLHAIELVVIRRELAAGGFLNWTVLRNAHPALLRSTLAPWADGMFTPPGFFGLVWLQIVASLAIIVSPSGPPVWALGSVLATRILCNVRNAPAMIGADQMHVVVLAACFLQALVPIPDVAVVCGWFVCLQLLLAYVTSGVAKAVSPLWRGGIALRQITRSRAVGLKVAFEWASRFPALAITVCWATIVFEIAFPWLIVGGPSSATVFLAAGLLFHVGIAVVMGLEAFFWPYVAAYPLAYRCSMMMDALWRS